MRRTALIFALVVAACGQSEPPPPPAPSPAAVAAPWFICDAINAPVLLVFERDGSTARVAQYDKPNGALVERTEYQIGDEEGAAGSVYTTLMQNGAEAGAVRRINPGMLEVPASAYTPPFTSVRLGERDLTCRWLPRTHVFAFTGRRSFAVHEDADGDLIYTTYDFATAAQTQPIELSENGRTTSFSAEVRDGAEVVSADGAIFTFDNQGFRYVVAIGRDGAGSLSVSRDGEDVQTEPLIAFIQGDGAE